MSVRVYGHPETEVSMGRVTQGFLEAFTHNHIAVDGVVSLDEVSNPLDDIAEPVGGWDAKHGVLCSLPNQLGEMARSKHERKWACVAPNSNLIGSQLKNYLLDEATDILAPSAWAVEQLNAEFNGKLRVHCVPHGVSPRIYPHKQAIQMSREAYKKGRFEVAHFSSSAFDRKGTKTLIKAFKMAKLNKSIPECSEIYLVLDRQAYQDMRFYLVENDLMGWGITCSFRRDMSMDNVAHTLGGFHCVAQPSRGEGFGLIPLEARAAGVPVLMTNCTGHTEHFDTAGTVEVPHGELEPLNDLPGSVAPSVSVEDVADSLGRAYSLFPRKSHELEGKDWSDWHWANKLSAFCKELNT